ncbi:MAG: pyridoxal phosphate-dependent aminotransferase [Proteobacteria bacterium]|nr:pyridoxal phosphate-dependent aminotransferase [Pseudomonadota bacterium]
MTLPPFLLHEWLEGHENMPFNLARSRGPDWTLGDLLRLGDAKPDLERLALGYAPPEGAPELRSLIGDYLDVDPDWVVVTNGASEAFALAVNVLARPGGNIVLPHPAYPGFAGVAAASSLDVRSYRLARESRFRLDGEAVHGLVDGETVLVVANSPQNPTGGLLPRADAALLAARLGERHVPLLVDEVFHPIYFDVDRPSSAGLENVIVVGDMSKALSLPGLRIGWIVDRDPVRRSAMATARSYLSLGGSPVLEALAAHALRNRAAILARARSVAARNLAALSQFMARVPDVLSWAPPQAGVLAFPWFADGRDSRPFCEHLASKGVLVVPGDCFGTPDHVRIGFGSQDDGVRRALDIFEAELRDVAG